MAKRDNDKAAASEPHTGETLPATINVSSQWHMSIGDPPDRWPTNLDVSTEAGRARLVNAMNPPTLSMDDHGTIRMRLCAYVCCMSEAEDRETGEISAAPKTVLMDAEGRTYVTRSRYAPEKMRNFQAIFGPAAWVAGIPIVIREYRSPRTKQTSHVIEIDLSQPM